MDSALTWTRIPIIDIHDCYELLQQPFRGMLESAIHRSDVSFGSNDDTLISKGSMLALIDKEPSLGGEGFDALLRALNRAPEDAMIGMGC